MKKPRVKKSESEIVKDYALKVIHGKMVRGHADQRFGFTKTAQTNNKDLWLDTDFYFSVVFQSTKQKNDFIEQLVKKFQVPVDEDDKVQIINGLKLAEKLGIKLENEKNKEFPQGDLDLRPFCLDNEK